VRVADADLERASELLRSRAGFRFDPVLTGRLVRCLDEAAGVGTVGEYVHRVGSDPVAFQDLVDRVTIQESSFFRDPAQFLALAKALASREEPGMIWSAACANGQEPWSLAMVLAEQGRSDWTVLATDISRGALARASAGRYDERALRQLSPERRERFFDCGEVRSTLRGMVTFSHHNLAATTLPFSEGACSIAFCRNVLIYLTDEQITSFLNLLGTGLAPGGQLFLGYSESLWRLRTKFVMRRVGESFVYEVEGQHPYAARRHQAAPPRRRRPPVVTPSPTGIAPADADVFIAEGHAALAAGDHSRAVEVLRKAVYLRPDDAGAQLHLGFAFEGSGDMDAAARCFRQARRGLAGAAATNDAAVDGWTTEELLQVLDRKLEARA
jgi:chemotaxis methyl-accepting protein methylase